MFFFSCFSQQNLLTSSTGACVTQWVSWEGFTQEEGIKGTFIMYENMTNNECNLPYFRAEVIKLQYLNPNSD